MQHVSHRIALLSLAAAMALATQPALAQQGNMAQQVADRFKAADKDHDGKLTLEEAREGMPRVAQVFDQIDTGKTGSITLQQIGAFMKSRKK